MHTGHATLATSSVLYFESKNTNKTLVFSTASGDLTTTLLDNDSIEMVLPCKFESRVALADGVLVGQSVAVRGHAEPHRAPSTGTSV